MGWLTALLFLVTSHAILGVPLEGLQVEQDNPLNPFLGQQLQQDQDGAVHISSQRMVTPETAVIRSGRLGRDTDGGAGDHEGAAAYQETCKTSISEIERLNEVIAEHADARENWVKKVAKANEKVKELKAQYKIERENTDKILIEKDQEIKKVKIERENTDRKLIEKDQEIAKVKIERENTDRKLIEKEQEIAKVKIERENTDRKLIEKDLEITNLKTLLNTKITELEVAVTSAKNKTCDKAETSLQECKSQVEELQTELEDTEERVAAEERHSNQSRVMWERQLELHTQVCALKKEIAAIEVDSTVEGPCLALKTSSKLEAACAKLKENLTSERVELDECRQRAPNDPDGGHIKLTQPETWKNLNLQREATANCKKNLEDCKTKTNRMGTFAMPCSIGHTVDVEGNRFAVSVVPLAWRQAESTCRQYGMQLLSLESAEKQRLATQAWLTLGSKNPLDARVHTSGSDAGRDKLDFAWHAGKRVMESTNWDDGFPKSHESHHHCVTANMLGKWTNDDCSRTLHFICEQA